MEQQAVNNILDGIIRLSLHPHERPILPSLDSYSPNIYSGADTLLSDGPLHPKYARLEDRISSFDATFETISSTVTPESLAEAGFYFYGHCGSHRDAVKCYHCAIGLLAFVDDDNPMEEHAKFRPDCPFVVANLKRPFTTKDQENVIKLWSKMSMVKYIATVVERRVIDAVLIRRWNEKRAPYETIQEFYTEISKKIESLYPDLEPCAPASEVDTCKVCLDKQISILFSPCTHLVCCSECSQKLKLCPYCRSPIFGRLIARFT